MQIEIHKKDGTTFTTNVTTLAKAIYPHVTADTSFHYALETDFINGVYDAVEGLVSSDVAFVFTGKDNDE